MMTDSSEFANKTDPAAEPEVGGEGWSGSDIEEAYLKALQAMEDIPWEEGTLPQNADELASPPGAAIAPVLDTAPAAGDTSTVALTPGDETTAPADDLPAAQPRADSAEPPPPPHAPPTTGPRLAQGTGRPEHKSAEERLNVSPAQVIEAALFVGGGPLTARKICGLLRGSLETREVEQTIDKLNDDYLAQARPYEIRLGDGGYRLELRPQYDRLRHRVYGSGPREVRLSQDVLEVLALVAYLQPISEREIVERGKQNAGNLLRQLLRRDLIAFERGPGGRKDVQYHTTARFLSVFGLGGLDELPQAGDLAKK
jgi:segregation and condensation protein B